jgi:hypothetical protein
VNRVAEKCVADIVRMVRRKPGGERPAGATHFSVEESSMSKVLRGLAAGYGAKKLGGGCFSTVLIFILLWWLLGHFGVFR